MCPIAHVPHWPCAPSPMCPIPQGTPSLSLILTMIPLCPCPIAHVSHCPCTPLAMCPITHVAHYPCAPSPRCPISTFSINHDTHLPIFPIAHMSKKMSSCQKDVKLSKRYQVVKKMSNVKKSNTLTMEEVQTKKKIDIMRFTHIDVNFDITYDGDQKPSKCA